jgi:hypothetical protein
MNSTNVRTKQSCPKCNSPLSLWSRPIIDPAASPQDYQTFLADRLNPKACGSCGLALDMATPTVINGRHWVGVVLENPGPIPATKALEIVATLTQDLGVLDAKPSKPILVVGRSEELRRILANKADDRFCAISLVKVAMRNFADFIEMMSAVSDAYLEADQPESAYWMLSEAVGMFNELYFQPVFFDLLEMTALAAGSRIAPRLRVPQTAVENFAFMKSQLEPHRRPIPKWCFSTYLCFYERGPHPPWSYKLRHLWTTVVDLLSLGPDGSFNLKKAERHQISQPVQAVAQEDLSNPEQARVFMLYLMTVSETERRLKAIPPDVQSATAFCSASLGLKWDAMDDAERADLERTYYKLTGLDFRSQFRL